MVSLSNNGLSDECMKKRLSENGCHTFHFGVTPKHKVQKVWAVRDFPSGCGRNAPKIDLSHKENAMVTISENTADNSSPLPKNKYCQRRVFAVRDFPPFCGRNAPMPTEQDRLGGTEASKRVVVLHKEVTENGPIETLKNVMGTGTWHMKLTASQEADSLSKIEVTGSKCSLMERTTVCIENPEDVHDSYIGRSQLERTIILPETVTKKENDDAEKIVGKEKIVYSQNECEKATTARHALGSVNENIWPIVHGLMAEPYCLWKQMNQTSLDGMTRRNQVQKSKMHRQKKSLAVARKSIPKTKFSRRQFVRTKSGFIGEAAEGYSNALVASNGRARGLNREALPEESPIGPGHREFNVNLPPFGSSSNDARSKVRETLRLFQSICRKILQGEESNAEVKPKQKDKKKRRIDIQASNFIKERGKEVNTGPRILGEVPGVEVGDAFQYRVELALVGVHRLYQAGIDFLNNGGMLVASSIVASGGYDDDLGDADELIYSGQGGNLTGKDKTPEDQKLVKGNLALKNSIATRNPVRVIRGSKAESTDGRANLVTTYVYDGLYTVQNYWTERGPHGKLVFMFKLVRIPGQPALTWREVKSSRKSKVRHGVCVPDITEGKESLPITAVNTIDGEKPPPFSYIKKMIYPDGFHPAPPKGCDCIGRCSDAKRCSCAVKNGGEIPFNRNGAIVEVKPLVYECGPLCKCPPSCYNRVSQHGIKIPLEIFKTDKRGWGVRAVTSISSGTFICEYAGEILEDREAEQRIGSDEYLFDIGKNYSDCTANSSGQADLNELADEGGFTIDAAHYGNIGRFINHSCSPNLYAQNVVYDHEDKKMPHIMLFAADNIPPLKELSYHYNYAVDQVYDSDGKIKVKRCFCGSSDCTGRMY